MLINNAFADMSYTKLSGLSNDRSYYLNLLDHVFFWRENMTVNEKKKRIRFALVVITLNIHINTW